MSTHLAVRRVPMNDVTVSDVTTNNVTTQNNVACTIGSFLLRLALTMAIIFLFALLSRAGGPKDVAGSAYFNSAVTGQPLTWPQGAITYFTDQGALSPILPNAQANSLVANAFSQWTSISTAAVLASSGGQLAEDVSGANVYINADGSITMPADIQPTASGTPVGIVYDYDGSVTDALLGAGAGDPTQCFSNAVFGGDDNFSTTAVYQHALIVINGQCALQSSQLTDIEYRLVRVIGGVLGIGWSQLNLNVITGSPPPISDDFAGFPVMHYLDPVSCVPITKCYANPYQVSSDDAAALSRLYPVTAQNQSSFPGKQIFAATTARIHGSIWFTNSAGSPMQAMQGVNVVARWVNPQTSTASGQYAVASVSGFLFTGNAGNPITGVNDNFGSPLAEWGSNQTEVEGFFDLAGLPLPTGGTAEYRLSVEALDPDWSAGVESYGPNQVSPSGSFTPIVVTVSAGQDVAQDIWMSGTAQPVPPLSSSATWSEPAAIPLAGDWMGSLSGYGDQPYFLLPVQANRTLSVAVTALDESGRPTNSKVRPVIGMWNAADPPGTIPSARTTSPFNSTIFGVTRLDAQVNSSGEFLIGIADDRGDGRPDYHYHASVLYADSVSPGRVGVNGGPITVYGMGFTSGLTATIGTTPATVLSISARQMILAAPPAPDGLASISITNPANGASTTMTNVLTYGAAATDKLLLLSKTNPPTPVGVQAMNPVSVEVVEADGVTPVPGATIAWSATNGVQLSACGGATACSVMTDGSGEAATWLTPTAAGNATITATLAPGAYSQTQSVNATLVATESSSDIGVLTPYLWIAQGATVSAPLTARVLNNGVPQTNAQVNFTLLQGSGTLSAATAQTNANGYASVTLSVTQFWTQIHLTACVAPANAPCQSIYVVPVPASLWQLWLVSGAGQISTGQAFQPIVVRVTDSSSPPNSVLGAPVAFLTTVLRPGGAASGGGGGDTNTSNPAMPVILNVSQSSDASDSNGLASIVPSSAGYDAPLEVDVGVTAGNASLNFPLKLLPAIVTTTHPVGPQPVLPMPWVDTETGFSNYRFSRH
jgi:hypothetical protein